MLGLEDDGKLTLHHVPNKLGICRGCKTRAIMDVIGGTLSYREYGWIAQVWLWFSMCSNAVDIH